jgi:tRNA(fMet)-specific endonuclease VapC
MPPYLLDSDHCIGYLDVLIHGHAEIATRIASLSASDLRVSIFTAMELAEGPWHSETWRGYHITRAKLHNFLSWITILHATHMTVEEFGRLRAALRRKGQMIGDLDTAIAATALSHGLTLVTHNTAHFSRIPGLLLEDWYP